MATETSVREMLVSGVKSIYTDLGFIDTSNIYDYPLEQTQLSKYSDYLTCTLSGSSGNYRDTQAVGVEVTSEEVPYAGAGQIWFRTYTARIYLYYPFAKANDGSIGFNKMIEGQRKIRGKIQSDLYPTLSGLIDRIDSISTFSTEIVSIGIDNKEGLINKGTITLSMSERNPDY